MCRAHKKHQAFPDEYRSLHPCCRLWKCSRTAIWQERVGSVRFSYMAEHRVWQPYVRVPCANAAYLFTQLDLKRIGRSQEMFSLHWWGSPHVIVRSEAEACHGHGSTALRQHSISSMCFVIKRFGFPAGWMCTSNPIGHSLEQLCLKQHRNKSCIMGITCATQWWIPSFINSSVEFATQLQPYLTLI